MSSFAFTASPSSIINNLNDGYNPDECPAFRPCYHPEDCWDAHAIDTSPEHGGACTSCCWKLLWTLAASGILLIIYGDTSISRTSLGSLIARYIRKVMQYKRHVQWYRHHHGDKLDQAEIHSRIQQARDRKRDIFTTTNNRSKVRLFSNFGKDLNDPTVVHPEAPVGREYTPKQYSTGSYAFSFLGMISNLGHILSTQYIYAIVWSSLGWGLLASSISTYIWLHHSHGEFCVEQGYYESDTMTNRSSQYTEIYTRLRFDYLYLTLFVLTGYVAFVATRWRGWLQNCHDIQHGLHSVAMLCGGAMDKTAVAQLPQHEQMALRYKLHKIYRHLNCIHAMTYLTTSRQLQNLSIKETLHDQLGLLTLEELEEVGPQIQHDLPMAVVLSWLTQSVMDLLYSTSTFASNVPQPLAYLYTPAYSQLAPLQKACENHENCYVLNQPNFYRDVVLVAMTIFMLMVILGEPFGSFVYVGRDTVNTESLLIPPCFQPMTLYSVFVLTVAVRTLFLSIMVLNNPFEYQSEQISVDHLLASSERTIFFHLRANFGRLSDSKNKTRYDDYDYEDTTHTSTNRESISSFAEETRHSMALRRLQQQSGHRHHHRNVSAMRDSSNTSHTSRFNVSFAVDSSHHHRFSDSLPARGRVSDASLSPEDLARMQNSKVSFADDFAAPKNRVSDVSFGPEDLARMQNSKVSFANVLVEEMAPLTTAKQQGLFSHPAMMRKESSGVRGFLRSLSDGSTRGTDKRFKANSKHQPRSTELDAAAPRSMFRRSWTSGGSSSLTFPLPDTKMSMSKDDDDTPSVTSFITSSSGTSA